jgi:hypothetical protein
MANLSDVEQVTRRLAQLASELRAEITERDGDFGRMVALADEIGESADQVAATLARIDDVLARRLAEHRPGEADEEETQGDLTEALSPRHRSGERTTEEGNEELTREELYARARAAGIPGRSKMSRDELIEALRSGGRAGT